MQEILKTIETSPLVPIFYHDDIARCIEVIDSCYKGGVKVFEFVNRGAHARQNFEMLISYRNGHWPDLKLGVGTIKSGQEAKDFLVLKADFIVSPIVNKEIGEVTLGQDICWIPGAMTPTEINLAAQIGAQLVKLFPGDVLGPQFVKAVKPVFPGLKFMVTGGVAIEEESIRNWMLAGVAAIGAGSGLFSTPIDVLEKRVAMVLHWIQMQRSASENK